MNKYFLDVLSIAKDLVAELQDAGVEVIAISMSKHGPNKPYVQVYGGLEIESWALSKGYSVYVKEDGNFLTKTIPTRNGIDVCQVCLKQKNSGTSSAGK